METCAHTGQQSCTFAGNVGPPGGEEFNMCAQQESIRLAAHTDWAQQHLESKDRDSTAQQNCTKQKHSAPPWFMQSKTHTHRSLFLCLSGQNPLSSDCCTQDPTVKGRRDGLLGRSHTEWEQHQASQAFYSGQVVIRASLCWTEVLTVKFSWTAISHRNTQGTLAAGPSDIWQTQRFNLITDPIYATDVACHNCTSQER